MGPLPIHLGDTSVLQSWFSRSTFSSLWGRVASSRESPSISIAWGQLCHLFIQPFMEKYGGMGTLLLFPFYGVFSEQFPLPFLSEERARWHCVPDIYPWMDGSCITNIYPVGLTGPHPADEPTE